MLLHACSVLRSAMLPPGAKQTAECSARGHAVSPYALAMGCARLAAASGSFEVPYAPTRPYAMSATDLVRVASHMVIGGVCPYAPLCGTDLAYGARSVIVCRYAVLRHVRYLHSI
eukprot:761415-Rhodomonas_salina.1